MPAEHELHEGTWLQWPHNNLYGPFYVDDVESSWIAMTDALQSGEKVHIVAVDSFELERIQDVLSDEDIPFTNLGFYVYPNDDVWVRDNGPMFVLDTNDNLALLDWGFNGWGMDTPFSNCDAVPPLIGDDLGVPVVDLGAMVLEGGAIEQDGNGTLMATRSSVTHSSRNPDLTEAEIEDYFYQYMGITQVIWLDGVYGLELTDQHIDGFARFANDSTIITMSPEDLTYWEVTASDQEVLFNATDTAGVLYDFIIVPLTQNNVTTTYGTDLGYKGSYVNYYIANEVVLVPTYDDPSDAVAISILSSVHPDKTVVGIDVRNIYEYGGMVHCITQQQPFYVALNIEETTQSKVEIYPNPTNGFVQIPSSELEQVELTDLQGKEVAFTTLTNGINISNLPAGVYILSIDQQQFKLVKE
ncbi:MAG: agmatine deiminase family protein [Flavobacteriales bacterium]|nr:agmatine deiminase family protein [Flavobacteriales bacterium]